MDYWVDLYSYYKYTSIEQGYTELRRQAQANTVDQELASRAIQQGREAIKIDPFAALQLVRSTLLLAH